MSENNSELLNAITEYLSLGINQQLDYDKFYLYSIITHSTAIEGSTVTEIENQLLFDEGITSKRPMVEQQYKKSMQNDTLKPQNDTLNDTLKLSDKEIRILGLIKADLHIKIDELMEETGYSRPTVMRAIKALKERNILQRVDSKKTGSWKIS